MCAVSVAALRCVCYGFCLVCLSVCQVVRSCGLLYVVLCRRCDCSLCVCCVCIVSFVACWFFIVWWLLGVVSPVAVLCV